MMLLKCKDSKYGYDTSMWVKRQIKNTRWLSIMEKDRSIYQGALVDEYELLPQRTRRPRSSIDRKV